MNISTLTNEPTSTLAAVIHVVCPRDEMGTHFPAAIQELMKVIGEQGIEIVGSGGNFAHHCFDSSSENFDFEVGYCINKPVVEIGRVKNGKVPTFKKCVYAENHGGYENLWNSWESLAKYSEANGLKFLSSGLEVYEIGYHSNVSEEQFVTKLYREVQEKEGEKK